MVLCFGFICCCGVLGKLVECFGCYVVLCCLGVYFCGIESGKFIFDGWFGDFKFVGVF